MQYKRPRLDNPNSDKTMSESESCESDTMENLEALCHSDEEMDREDHEVGLRATPPHNSQNSQHSQHSQHSHHSHHSQPPHASQEEEPGMMEEEEQGDTASNAESQQPHASQNSQHSHSEGGFKGQLTRELDEIMKSPLANADLFSHFYLPRTIHTNGLLVIPAEHYGRMCCYSKYFYVEPSNSQTSNEGVELSFVFPMIRPGLPTEALRVIYFFLKILYLSKVKALDGYCVPTKDLKLVRTMPSLKTTHMVQIVQGKDGNDFMMDQDANPIEACCADGGIDLEKLIASEDTNTEGEKKQRVPVLTIRVGITGAVSEYTDNNTQKKQVKHDAFCCVLVQFINNISPLDYIVNLLLAPPGANANQEIREEHAETFKLLDEILLYQAAHIIGDTSGKLPSTYFSDPCGRLGWSTICNPFMLSLIHI